MRKIEIINKKIAEINELQHKYIYEYSKAVELDIPLPYELRAKTTNGYIVYIRGYETLKDLYQFLEGVLHVLYIK